MQKASLGAPNGAPRKSFDGIFYAPWPPTSRAELHTPESSPSRPDARLEAWRSRDGRTFPRACLQSAPGGVSSKFSEAVPSLSPPFRSVSVAASPLSAAHAGSCWLQTRAEGQAYGELSVKGRAGACGGPGPQPQVGIPKGPA